MHKAPIFEIYRAHKVGSTLRTILMEKIILKYSNKSVVNIMLAYLRVKQILARAAQMNHHSFAKNIQNKKNKRNWRISFCSEKSNPKKCSK